MADKMLKIELKKSLIGRGAKQILSLIHISSATLALPNTLLWRSPLPT